MKIATTQVIILLVNLLEDNRQKTEDKTQTQVSAAGLVMADSELSLRSGVYAAGIQPSHSSKKSRYHTHIGRAHYKRLDAPRTDPGRDLLASRGPLQHSFE